MKKILALVATASLMFSCTKSEDVIPDAGKLPINISIGQQTRANDTTYENGDKVGIYVVNYNGATAGTLATSGNQVDNAQFTFDGSKWSPENSIYWKDKSTAADFYAYYPYSESTNISAHSFSVQADQSSEDAFWASDFLWGKTTKVSPTKNAVPIETNHSLSRILVDIKPGNGFTAESWAAATKSVKICDVKTSATIDLSTGIATATGNNGEIIPLAAAKTGTTLSYQAMMIPQVVADNSKLVVVTVDGVDYVYRKGFTFKANTQHKFTITVNKSGSSVDVTIGEWTTEETPDVGTAEEESESETTIPNNQIWYTATAKVEPNKSTVYWSHYYDIESNEWNEATGNGIITFDCNVTSIGTATFSDKHILKSIILPNTITYIGEYAFEDCSKLTSITIPESVNSIGARAFTDCYGLEEFKGKFASNDGNCLIVNGVLNSFASVGITEYTIPDSVQEIGVYAFNGHSNLTSINIPTGVTKIGEGAFAYCSGLTNITISNSVMEIGDYAFFNFSDVDVYINNTTPPTIVGNDLFSTVIQNVRIYVPAQSVDKYKIAEGWKDYADIIFADPTENQIYTLTA